MSNTKPTGAPRASLKMEKTSVPGVFKRGTKYVITYRDRTGRQRKESFRTLTEAKKAKTARTASVDDGSYQPTTNLLLHEHAPAWLAAYRGKSGRGFRENTRSDYADLLDHYALTFFGPKTKLTDITPKAMADFVRWLDNPEAQGQARADRKRLAREEKARAEGRPVQRTPITATPTTLSPATIARACVPLRSLLRQATQEGLLRHNPAAGLELPGAGEQPDAEYIEGQDPDDEGGDVKVFTHEQLACVLAVVHPRHRLFFELLACTGLRISEAIALEWRHLKLDGDEPVVQVRRAIVRGKLGAPKSRYGKRDVAIPLPIVYKLREVKTDRKAGPGDIVFPSARDTPLHPGNLRRRILKPACEEAGAGWAAFHTFRHTFASMQVAQGCNIVQLSRVLGHHSPAFTLSKYTHLFPGGGAPALDVLAVLAGGQQIGNGPKRSEAISDPFAQGVEPMLIGG
jgi:integrase